MNNKITILTFSLRHGGAEKVCLTLCNEFVKRNYDVELWIADNSESPLTKKLDEKVTVFPLNKKHVRNCVTPLARLLVARKPERLLVFHIELAILAIVLKKLLFLRTSITVRSINTLSQAFTYPKNIWEKYFAKQTIRRLLLYSDKIIAQSTGMKHDLMRTFNIPSDKIVTIHNPAFLFSSNGEGLKYELQESKNEFLFVGRLNPQKGLQNLIKAFKLAHDKNPDIRLLLVGDGSEREELEALVKKLNLADDVIFEGFRTDIKFYYKRAKATLLTSNFEGFPNVLVESISAGTPVISFNCPSGPDDIIEDGINGLLVPHLDVESFSEAILSVANDQNKFDTQEVIKTAKKFSIDSIISQYEHELF